MPRRALGLARHPPRPSRDGGPTAGGRPASLFGLEREGYTAMLSTGVLWHWYIAQARIVLPPELARLDLWTPDYTRGKGYRLPVDPAGKPYPWDHAKVHRCAGGGASIEGSVAGIKGAIDVNHFRGTEAELAAWWDAARRRARSCPA